jgi:hypothetical protein
VQKLIPQLGVLRLIFQQKPDLGPCPLRPSLLWWIRVCTGCQGAQSLALVMCFVSRSKTLASTLFHECSVLLGWSVVQPWLDRWAPCSSSLLGSHARRASRQGLGLTNPQFRRDWLLRLLPEPVTFSPPLSRRHEPNTPSSGCRTLDCCFIQGLTCT